MADDPSSHHGSPAPSPVQTAKSLAASVKASLPKPPKPPEKPLMPYMRYSRQVWDSVKSSNKECKLWEIGRVIGQQWRELAVDVKQKFTEEYEQEKVHYGEAMRVYHATPAYQQYTQMKEKAMARAEEEHRWQAHNQQQQQQTTPHHQQPMPHNMAYSGPQHHDPQMQHHMAVSALRNSLITNQAGGPNGQGMRPHIEDDDTLAVPTKIQSAYVRYTRNQRLMLDVMSETAVPDARTVVTVPRLHMLKRQANSLLVHQKKLNGELEQIGLKFDSKRQCLFDACDKYDETVTKMATDNTTVEVDGEEYKVMITGYMEKLLEDYNKYMEMSKKGETPKEEGEGVKE